MRLLHKLHPSRKIRGGSILSTLHGAITKHPTLATNLLKGLHGLVGASALAGTAYGLHKLLSKKEKKQDKQGDGLLQPGRPRVDMRQHSDRILRSQMMSKVSQEGTEPIPHIYPSVQPPHDPSWLDYLPESIRNIQLGNPYFDTIPKAVGSIAAIAAPGILMRRFGNRRM